MTSGVFTIPLVSTDGPNGPSLSGLPHAPPELHAFIAGPENALLRVLLQVVETQPYAFPLITLCGPTGVGKSHLLQGLTERQRHLQPSLRIAFGTGADYARAYARAVDVDSITDWRDKQRQCDLFMLDDLQDLATKPAAQFELLNTLDALAERESQTVLAIRQAPLDWAWMPPQLRSRLHGGLVIPITTPSASTADFIFQELSAPLGLPAGSSPVVASTPANLTTYNQIRRSVLRQRELRTDTYPATATEDTRQKFVNKIAKAVARQFHVKLPDLLSSSRRHSIVRARGVAIYLSRTLLQLSFTDIGGFFGGRDHTTILYSWRKTSEQIQSNAVLRHEVEKLSRALRDNFEIQQRDAQLEESKN